MIDGNTAALKRKMAQVMAEADRKRLVAKCAADLSGKNDSRLRDYLADLAAEDGEFLHALQRGDVARMQSLFRDAVDFRCGDDLVNDEANRLAGVRYEP